MIAVENNERSHKMSAKIKDRLKLPSEVERWALGLMDEESKENTSGREQKDGFESDDYDAIDDSYLRTIGPVETNKNENNTASNRLSKEKYLKLQEILYRVKTKQEIDPELNEKKFAMYLERLENEETEKRQVREEKKRVASGSGFRFKSVNNGMTRGMPNTLQQNITIERTFFKDLIKLSKQRYLSKLSQDFYKRRFVKVQTRKGFMTDNSSTPTTSRSQSNLQQVTNITTSARKTKSPFQDKDTNSLNTMDSLNMPRLGPKSISALGTTNQKSTESAKNKTVQIDSTIKTDNLKGKNKLNELKKNGINQRPKTSIGLLNSISEMNRSSNSIGGGGNLKTSYVTSLSSKSQLEIGSLSYKSHNDAISQLLVPFHVNNYNENNEKEGAYGVSGGSAKHEPIKDSRYIRLFQMMSNPYEPVKKSDVDPARRVSALISSNKALQGPGWNGSFDKEKKNMSQIDFNKKLFEKMSFTL